MKNMTKSFRGKTLQFLGLFKEKKWNLTETLNEMGVERGVFKTWMDNPVFKAEYEQALEERVDYLEGLMIAKAADGKDKMSAVSGIFLLKSYAPEKFNERIVNQIKYDVSLKDLVMYGEESGRTRIRAGKEEAGKEARLIGSGDNGSPEHSESDSD